jgi:hypothetical protein
MNTTSRAAALLSKISPLLDLAGNRKDRAAWNCLKHSAIALESCAPEYAAGHLETLLGDVYALGRRVPGVMAIYRDDVLAAARAEAVAA